MQKNQVYLYGMITMTSSFLLKNGFVKPDEYAEITKRYRFPGGETGSGATVLSSLGIQVKMDGNVIGKEAIEGIKDFYADKTVDLSSLCFDPTAESVEDYVIIADDVRSPMGSFGKFYQEAFAHEVKPWSIPKPEDIEECQVAAIDPFFGEESEKAARLCAELKKPYVTIDCRYDSYLHKHADITVISGEGLENQYPGKTREEMFPLFRDNSDGLTIVTNGSKGFLYGRKGAEPKNFKPFSVKVVSTLGAGDTFKAGCTYALLKNMADDEIVAFASACSAVAISRFPLPLYPPTLQEVQSLLSKR